MSNTLFSILVANYNNGHFFKDCYASIIAQTYENWEVIIIDDCSTDGSVEMIKQIIGDDNRFKLFINDKNKGCGYTKNKCAALANGKVLGFLDPDDALKKDALAIMISAHIKKPSVSIITSKYDLVDLQMNFIKKGMQGGIIPQGKSYLTSTQGILTHFATFKKSKYDLSVGIDIEMKRAVDQDLYYKLEEQGGHLFIDKILYLYRIHENSISANKNEYKAKYWHFYAMVSAYKRRAKKKIEIDNLTVIQYKRLKSTYYFSRFERAKEQKKCWQKYYFLAKSIMSFPRHNLRYKLKTLIK